MAIRKKSTEVTKEEPKVEVSLENVVVTKTEDEVVACVAEDSVHEQPVTEEVVVPKIQKIEVKEDVLVNKVVGYPKQLNVAKKLISNGYQLKDIVSLLEKKHGMPKEGLPKIKEAKNIFQLLDVLQKG